MKTQPKQANHYASPHTVVTDADDTENELADRGTRLGAFILDGLVINLMVVVPLCVGMGVQRLAAIGHDDSYGPLTFYAIVAGAFLTTGPAGLTALVGLVVYTAVSVYFVKKNGQSIGKKVLGIKVVRTDGSPVSLGRIICLRNMVTGVLNLIPFIGPPYGLINILMILGKRRRCAHDRIADTIVIKA